MTRAEYTADRSGKLNTTLFAHIFALACLIGKTRDPIKIQLVTRTS